jgi:hypothetical protein
MFTYAIALAFAQESVVVDAPVQPIPEQADSGGRRPGGSTSTTETDEKEDTKDSGGKGKKGKKKKILGWSYQPYVAPGGGARIDSTNGVAVEAGADVGVKYWKENWTGDLYAGGTYATGESYSGYEIHVGDAMGRREKYWGVTLGVEGFYDGYLDTDGSTILAPSIGVDIPLTLIVGPKKYYAYGGVTPSWLADRSRHVDSLPFGDELEWNAGVGLKLEGIRVKAGFAQRITVAGTINTPTLSVDIGD